jgi:hypothetical protein
MSRVAAARMGAYDIGLADASSRIEEVKSEKPRAAPP